MDEAQSGNRREPYEGQHPEPAQGDQTHGDQARGDQTQGDQAQGAGPHMDPEQVRQFQQFQQFQEFLRYTQAQQYPQSQQPPPHQQQPQGPSGELTSTPPQIQPGQYGWPSQQVGHQPVLAGQPTPDSLSAPNQSQSPVPNQTPQPASAPWNFVNTPGTPPPPPPPPSAGSGLSVPKVKLPRWARKLLGKVLSIILLIIALVIAGNLIYDHFFPSTGNSTDAVVAAGGGTYHTNNILPHDPHEAVRAVYDSIAKNQPQRACGAMDTGTQQKFATDLHFPDCLQAMSALAGQVTNVNDYAESLPSYVSGQPQGQTISVSSCQFGVSGGPALGSFTLNKVEMGQWLIVGHQNEPNPCPPPTPSTTATP